MIARLAAADSRHLHHLVAADHQVGRDAVIDLEPFRFGSGVRKPAATSLVR